MIEIIDKKNCCGCSACVQACPVKCISLIEDDEGFSYPHVDKEKCIECGKCEKVCPFINKGEERKPLKVFAAKNPDETIRLKSSSGGIFSMLAEHVIRENGVVFGVRFNENWQPVFDYTETIEGIDNFRGSKYVQAIVGTAFSDVHQFLEQGRQVLFCGTPCQIAGLNRFLKKEYENLITMDIICHGVPSPLVWRQYIKYIVKTTYYRDDEKNTVLLDSEDVPVITDINFRDKKLGWKKYSFVVRGKFAESGQKSVLLSDMHRENLYMQAFLSDLIIRPSCFHCQVKSGRSGADITLGDFWGIQNIIPSFDDDKGISAVLLNSVKGQKYYSFINVEDMEMSLQDIIAENPAYIKSSDNNPLRELLFKEPSSLYMKQEFFFPKKNKIRRYIHRLLGLLKI